LKLSLKEDFLDAVLLYDVLNSYYFTAAERKKLIESINEMVKTNSLLSIYPKHMEPLKIKRINEEMKKFGFYLEREASANLIHNGNYDTGYILNFRKSLG